MSALRNEINFLHQKFDLRSDDTVEVTLDSRANVLLLDPDNFSKYKRGTPYTYHGGYAEKTPVRLTPPRSGEWHVVVNLGGYPGRVRASVRVIPS